MVIALSIGLGILTFLLLGTLGYLKKLEQQVILLDKEQHDQNKQIHELLKENLELKMVMLQHIDILKYLIDQDPMLGKMKIPYTGPIGEA